MRFIVTIAAWSLAACGPPGDVRALAGCYRFDAAYFTRATFDSALGRHPDSSATIQLDTMPNLFAARPRSPAFLVRVSGWEDSSEQQRKRALFSYWAPGRGNRLRLRWHNGYSGLAFDLSVRAESLRGGYRTESDAGGRWQDALFWWPASRQARASRTPCPG